MVDLTKTDFVILCGGLGKRLRSVTGEAPKVLVQVNGKPFLRILLEYIASQGGRRFVLCTGYGAETIENYLEKSLPHLELIFSREDEPLGTGGAIKKATEYVKSDDFVAMNGDCFCTVAYQTVVNFHQNQNAAATIAVSQVKDMRDFGTIEFSQDRRIVAFKEKTQSDGLAYVNTGTYCLKRDVFALVTTKEKFSIEYDFFPKLVGKNFFAYPTEGEFIDIGTPERYEQAQQFLRKVS